MLRELLSFAAAGALATVVHYLVLIGLVTHGALPVTASTVGAALGAATNYALNRRYTFRSRRAHRAAFPRYLLVAASGLLLNALMLGAFLPLLPHYLAAQLVATALVLAWNFALNRCWTFRGSRYAQ